MGAKFRKILIRVLVVLLIVVTVALVARAILNYTTGKKLERSLAQAKAEGVALKVKDLIPDCPDSDNAAPLWKAAEALLHLDEKDKSSVSKALDDSFYGRHLDDESRSRLAPIIKKNRRALDLAMDAAALPCLHQDLWDDPTAATGVIQVAPMIKMIQVTKLLAVEALLHADRGEDLAAMEECRSGMRLARLVMDEPSLINALIAVAVMKQMSVSFGRIVSGRDIDQKTLASWIGELDPQSWRSRFVKAVPVERANSLEVGLRIIKGDAAAIKPFSGLDGPNSRFWSWLVRPALKSELLWLQKAFEDMGIVSILPYFEQREILTKTSQRLVSSPRYSRMIGALFPDFHSSFLREATLEAVMLTTQVGLICKIYKARTGRYPEKLEALVPDFLREVPIDPFTGKPLVYKIVNGELLIYSLGSNQKDDGGRSSAVTQLVMEKDDDWTWRERIQEKPKKK